MLCFKKMHISTRSIQRMIILLKKNCIILFRVEMPLHPLSREIISIPNHIRKLLKLRCYISVDLLSP